MNELLMDITTGMGPKIMIREKPSTKEYSHCLMTRYDLIMDNSWKGQCNLKGQKADQLPGVGGGTTKKGLKGTFWVSQSVCVLIALSLDGCINLSKLIQLHI